MMSKFGTIQCGEVKFTVGTFRDGLVHFEAEEDGYELIEGKVWVRITPGEAEELAAVLIKYAQAAQIKGEEST